MTALLQRLDREQTDELIASARDQDITAIAARLPIRDMRTTSSPVGGLELTEADLLQLRGSVLALAREYGNQLIVESIAARLTMRAVALLRLALDPAADPRPYGESIRFVQVPPWT